MDKNIFKIKNSILENNLKLFSKSQTLEDMLKVDLELIKTLFFIPCNFKEGNYEFTFIRKDDTKVYLPTFTTFDNFIKTINYDNKLFIDSIKVDYVMIIDFSELSSFCINFPNITGCIINYQKDSYFLTKNKLNNLNKLISENPLQNKLPRYGVSLIENISEYLENVNNPVPNLDEEIKTVKQFCEKANYIYKVWIYKEEANYTLLVKHNNKDEKFFEELYNIFMETKINIKIKNTREAEALRKIKTLTPIYEKI